MSKFISVLLLLMSNIASADILLCAGWAFPVSGKFLGANTVKNMGRFTYDIEGYKFQPDDRNKGIILFTFNNCTVQLDKENKDE